MGCHRRINTWIHNNGRPQSECLDGGLVNNQAIPIDIDYFPPLQFMKFRRIEGLPKNWYSDFDIAAMVKGRLVLGECKSQSGEFSAL